MFGLRRKPQQIQTTAAAPDEQRSLAEPTAFELTAFGIMASAAGVSVTASTARQVPAVAAGVNAISEAVSILPLHAFTRNADGSRERDNDHPAFRLLNGDANPWTRGPQLRELLTADALFHGNGFAEIVRDGQRNPRELHRLNPTGISIEIDTTTGEPRYRMNVGSGQRFIDFMLSPEGQKAIGDFRVEGQQLFHPNAGAGQ